MALERKTISVSMPQELYDLMLKLRDDHMKGKTGNSEIVWECIKTTAAYHYNWSKPGGELELSDPEVNEAEEIIRRYEINKTRHKISDKGGGRPKTSNAKLKRQIRKILSESNKPLALIHIADRIKGVGRKRVTKALEEMEGKTVVIHRPKEVGKSWSIALIGTEAEQRVNKLNRVEDNTASINKRRNPKKERKTKEKKVVRKRKGSKKIRRTSK